MEERPPSYLGHQLSTKDHQICSIWVIFYAPFEKLKIITQIRDFRNYDFITKSNGKFWTLKKLNKLYVFQKHLPNAIQKCDFH